MGIITHIGQLHDGGSFGGAKEPRYEADKAEVKI